MSSGFGAGHDFEMKRLKVNQSKYLIVKLEMLEKKQDKKEERFNELHRYLGPQYCYGLEPSAVGFKRCVVHLLLEQTRTYLVVAIIVFFNDRLWQLLSVFVVQNLYFGIQLTWVKAESGVMGWINFAFCMTVNYYQLTTLVEVK